MILRFTPIPALLSASLLLACNQHKAAAGAADPPAPTATGTVIIPPQNGPRFGGVENSDSLFFTLKRTPCFGACKTYTINIYRSGFATYEGSMNVDLLGKYTGQVAPEIMEGLLGKAEASGFFGMNDKYDAQVTDLPSTIIQIWSGGRMKKVIARVGTPPAFRALADYAEEQLMPLKWKAVPAKQ